MTGILAELEKSVEEVQAANLPEYTKRLRDLEIKLKDLEGRLKPLLEILRVK